MPSGRPIPGRKMFRAKPRAPRGHSPSSGHGDSDMVLSPSAVNTHGQRARGKRRAQELYETYEEQRVVYTFDNPLHAPGVAGRAFPPTYGADGRAVTAADVKRQRTAASQSQGHA